MLVVECCHFNGEKKNTDYFAKYLILKYVLFSVQLYFGEAPKGGKLITEILTFVTS